MTTITLPPEIEEALTEEARKQGVTPEQLALDSLRSRFLAPPEDLKPGGETLFDFLSGYIGIVDGTTEALSENCGEHFTEGLMEKHRQGHL